MADGISEPSTLFKWYGRAALNSKSALPVSLCWSRFFSCKDSCNVLLCTKASQNHCNCSSLTCTGKSSWKNCFNMNIVLRLSKNLSSRSSINNTNNNNSSSKSEQSEKIHSPLFWRMNKNTTNSAERSTIRGRLQQQQQHETPHSVGVSYCKVTQIW